MQISLGVIQIDLRSAAGRLPAKHSVCGSHTCADEDKVTPCTPKLQEQEPGLQHPEPFIPSSDMRKHHFYCLNSSSEMYLSLSCADYQ